MHVERMIGHMAEFPDARTETIHSSLFVKEWYLNIFNVYV